MKIRILTKTARQARQMEWHKFFAVWPRRKDDETVVIGKLMRRRKHHPSMDVKRRNTFEYCSEDEFIFAKLAGDVWTDGTHRGSNSSVREINPGSGVAMPTIEQMRELMRDPRHP